MRRFDTVIERKRNVIARIQCSVPGPPAKRDEMTAARREVSEEGKGAKKGRGGGGGGEQAK